MILPPLTGLLFMLQNCSVTHETGEYAVYPSLERKSRCWGRSYWNGYVQWLVTFTSDAQHSSFTPVVNASKTPLFFTSVNRLRLFYNVSVTLGGTCIIITYSASSFALQPKSRVCNVTGLCHTSLSGVHWNVTNTVSEGLPIRSTGVHAQTRWTQRPQEARFLITANKIASQALL